MRVRGARRRLRRVMLSLIHISEPTRLRRISYAVFCLKIVRSLKKVYTVYDPVTTHATLIPQSDREEMLKFLQHGPPDYSPPSWFKFLNRPPVVVTTVSSCTPTQPGSTTSNDERKNNGEFMNMFDGVFGTSRLRPWCLITIHGINQSGWHAPQLQ